jgi:hypothetical protein
MVRVRYVRTHLLGFQQPDKAIAIIIITLQLTFGGTPCPFEWGIMLESICDLANELLKCKDWDPKELHALVQRDIPQRQYLDKDVPFASGHELIADVPIDPKGYADVYINNTMGLTIDLSGTIMPTVLKQRLLWQLR